MQSISCHFFAKIKITEGNIKMKYEVNGSVAEEKYRKIPIKKTSKMYSKFSPTSHGHYLAYLHFQGEMDNNSDNDIFTKSQPKPSLLLPCLKGKEEREGEES